MARRRWAGLVIAAAVLAFAVKAALALLTYGSNDVLVWQSALDRIRTAGGLALYRSRLNLTFEGVLYHREVFNHPPFMIHLLRVLGGVAGWTGLPLRAVLRLAASLADAGSLWVTWRIMRREAGERFSPGALVLFALCPVSILVSGFHGNTDSIMIFFVLVAVYFLDVRECAWLSGAALAMALNIKIVPVIFLPAMLMHVRGWRARAVWLASAACVVFAGSLPYVFHYPIRLVLSYQSVYGHWGISRVLVHLPGRLLWLNTTYSAAGKYVMLAAILTVSIWMNRPSRRVALFIQCGVVVFLFLLLTPGFGIQYLIWLTPWVVALGAGVTLAHYCAAGAFAFLVYRFWWQASPWYFANALLAGDWHRRSVYTFEVLAYLSVAFVLAMYWRGIIGRKTD